MRIRTDGDYAHREDATEGAAGFYDCNKTKAVVSACEDVPRLVATARQVLERDDLILEQRQEIADTLPTRVTSFEIKQTVAVEKEETLGEHYRRERIVEGVLILKSSSYSVKRYHNHEKYRGDRYKMNPID